MYLLVHSDSRVMGSDGRASSPLSRLTFLPFNFIRTTVAMMTIAAVPVKTAIKAPQRAPHSPAEDERTSSGRHEEKMSKTVPFRLDDMHELSVDPLASREKS